MYITILEHILRTSDVMVRESNYLEKLYFDLRRYYVNDLINLKSKYILIDYIHDTLIFTHSLIPEKAGVVLRNPIPGNIHNFDSVFLFCNMPTH